MAQPNHSLSVASARGQRDYQEDRALCQWIDGPAGTGWLLAVFDGHGGAATAEKASTSFTALFESAITARPGNASEALREALASLHRLTREDSSGSTASVVFIPQEADQVHLAVLGDSPIAIFDAQGRLHIGPDHNIRANLKERDAATARGGIFRKGYLEDPLVPDTGLQMSRSLGDAELARVLNREPEIETVALGGRGIVLVGSDGLLLPGGGANTDQLKRLLELVRQGQDAEALVKDALARRTRDNVTAIVWKSTGLLEGPFLGGRDMSSKS